MAIFQTKESPQTVNTDKQHKPYSMHVSILSLSYCKWFIGPIGQSGVF